MGKHEAELVEKMHQSGLQGDGVQRCRRAQVEALFEKAVQRQQCQNDRERIPLGQRHTELAGHGPGTPPVESRKGVHYTELPEAPPNQPLAEEWNTYRAGVGQWLAEGREGRHVLIKRREVIGFFDSFGAAYETGWRRFGGQPFFVHAVCTEEQPLRIRGVNYPWPGSLSR